MMKVEDLLPRLRQLKSGPSRIMSKLLMCNCCPRTVDVLWVNYSGALIRYGRLEPGARMKLYSFTTHPWFFVDVETKQLLASADQPNRAFFMPPENDRSVNDHGEGEEEDEDHFHVKIILPALPLQSLCLAAVSSLCEASHISPATLELPKCIINELEELCSRRALYDPRDHLHQPAVEVDD